MVSSFNRIWKNSLRTHQRRDEHFQAFTNFRKLFSWWLSHRVGSCLKGSSFDNYYIDQPQRSDEEVNPEAVLAKTCKYVGTCVDTAATGNSGASLTPPKAVKSNQRLHGLC